MNSLGKVQNSYIFLPLFGLTPRRRSSPGTISVKFYLDVVSSPTYEMAQKHCKNFNRLSRLHERYRQTTDGRTTTYSDAKNSEILFMTIPKPLNWLKRTLSPLPSWQDPFSDSLSQYPKWQVGVCDGDKCLKTADATPLPIFVFSLLINGRNTTCAAASVRSGSPGAVSHGANPVVGSPPIPDHTQSLLVVRRSRKAHVLYFFDTPN